MRNARTSTKTNPVHQIAQAIERVRRERGEVEHLDLIALGFSVQQLEAHGLDARALHANLFPQVAA